MLVGFTTSYAINAYLHWCCEFESRSGRGVQHCDKICQWLATGRWFSPGPPVASTNKTDSHHITEILLKVALNTIKQAHKKTDPQLTNLLILSKIWCYVNCSITNVYKLTDYVDSGSPIHINLVLFHLQLCEVKMSPVPWWHCQKSCPL